MTIESIIIAILFPLIVGSYIFSWRVSSESRKARAVLWAAISELKHNEIRHIEERLDVIERRIN